MRNGCWAPVEVKLANQDSIEEAAANLIKFAADIDTSKMKPPSFLMIVTATPYAYRREDGVYVVPLGCIRAKTGKCAGARRIGLGSQPLGLPLFNSRNELSPNPKTSLAKTEVSIVLLILISR